MRTSIIQVVAAILLIFNSAASYADLSAYEKTCAELGFRPRTPAYGECVLELDRRAKSGQQNAPRSRVDQEQQQAESRRQEVTAMRGDGTPDHQSCLNYGFRPATANYAECRQKLDMARRELAHKQAVYEEEKRRYDEQLDAYEKEKERQRSLALMRFGAALAVGTSPYFSQNFGNAGMAALGLAPIAPQRPAMENYIITMPGGRSTNCTYVPSMRYMSCN